MLYKFNYAKQSYYDLVVTRNVEPKAKAELGGGGAATTDRRCEAVALATKDKLSFSVVARARSTWKWSEDAKAHWKVPALTRVRVRHRIHRWDGFLYNIDLFPFVERRLLAFIGWRTQHVGMYCTVSYFSTVQYGIYQSRRSACELTQYNSKIPLSLITKLPLAPKRELLSSTWVASHWHSKNNH